MTAPADARERLNNVEGCGMEVNADEYIGAYYHLSALEWAVKCTDCSRLLWEAVAQYEETQHALANARRIEARSPATGGKEGV